MSREEERQDDLVFMWENQAWVVSNSNNFNETKQKIAMEPPKACSTDRQKEQKNGGEGGFTEVDKQGDHMGANRIGKKIDDGDVKDVKIGESNHDIHIWTERERRKKMRDMFDSLHELLPHCPSKADKSTIVDQAVNYIKNQQLKLEQLQKLKLERLQSVSTFGYNQSVLNFQWHPPNSRKLLSITNPRSSINVTAGAITNPNSPSLAVPKQQTAFKTFASPNLVLSVCGDDAIINVCSPMKKGFLSHICFVLEKYQIEVSSAHISSDTYQRVYMIQAHVNKTSNQFLEANSMEEIFSQAAKEINIALAL